MAVRNNPYDDSGEQSGPSQRPGVKQHKRGPKKQSKALKTSLKVINEYTMTDKETPFPKQAQDENVNVY